jgi:general secretion pathway protein D
MNCRNRMKIQRVRLSLLLLCVAVLCTASVSLARDRSAGSLYKQGEAAEARDDIDTAYDDFYKAFQKNPRDLNYRTAYYRVRFSCGALHTKRGVALREKGEYSAALTEFLHALEVDPSNELATQEIEATREKMKVPGGESSIPNTAASELSEVASPIDLKPISNDPITLHMAEDSKVVYQTIGKAAGVNVLFDPEYTSKRIQIDLSSVSLFDALRIMGAVSGTFWRAVTPNTLFVAANTRAKRTELDEQAVQTFYLTNASQANDLNDIQTALRNVLANAKLYGVPSQNAIVMRGTPDELLLASKLIDDLDKARPEVVVDVAVLEVSRDKMRNIGISLPGTATVTLQSATNNTTTSSGTGTGTGTGTNTTTSNLTLESLSSLNANNFAVTIGQATANLLLSDTNTKILQNPRIRASDNQKATMKIGSRIPIATGSFSSGTSSALASSLVNTQFQYLDVGVNIDMTPIVHYDRDVTLKLKIEVSSQNGSVTISGVTEPIISQRTIEQVIRLREGEANILGGILTKQDSRAISGTPGLGEIPLLKYLFSTNSHDVSNDEIVFLLIPHVVRATQLSLLNTRQIDTGTGNSVEIRRIAAVTPPAPVVGQAATESSVAQQPTPPQMQPGAPVSGVGPVAGQTAAGAAQNALAAQAQSAVPAMPTTLQLVPPTGSQKVGSSFQIPVNLSNARDVFSVPMQLWYDPTKLTLVNVDTGGFLGRDGQAVALVHRDDGEGNVTVSAARPPGVAGVNGAGTVCILTFQAKAPGDAVINITKPGARNSAQQVIETVGSQAIVHVQ